MIYSTNANNSFTDPKEDSMIKSETRSKLKARKEKNVSEFNPGVVSVSATVTNRPSAKSRDCQENENSVKVYWFCRIQSEERVSVNQSCDKSDHPFNQTFASGSIVKVDNNTIYLPNEHIQYKLDSVYNAHENMDYIFENQKSPISKLLSGKDFMFVATGPKSSGKTHTIQGIREAPGILPKSLEYLFNCIKSKDLEKSVVITVNVLEINKKGYLDIIGCINKPSYKAKYKEFSRLSKIESVHNILKETIKYRKFKSEFQEESHFVITFNLEKLVTEKHSSGTTKGSGYKILSKLSIIELSSFNFENSCYFENKLNSINSNMFSIKNSKSVNKSDAIFDKNLGKFLKATGKKYDEKVQNYIESFFNCKSGKNGHLIVMLNQLQDSACLSVNKDFIGMLEEFKQKAKMKRKTSTNKKKLKENTKKTQSVEKEFHQIL